MNGTENNNMQTTNIQTDNTETNNAQTGNTETNSTQTTNIQTGNTETSNMQTNNVYQNNSKTKKCKKCKEQINKDAKICPYCRTKQGIPIWLIVIIVIIGIGIISGDENEDLFTNNVENSVNNSASDVGSTNNNSSSSNTIEYIVVSKDDLDEALENNAAAAKDTYYKKYVEVSGKLGTIDSDLSYISLMSSTNEWDFNGIHCDVKNSEQKQIIKTLSKDQEITIRGKITDVGEVLGYYLDITEIIVK